jgi:hypothetical protein
VEERRWRNTPFCTRYRGLLLGKNVDNLVQCVISNAIPSEDEVAGTNFMLLLVATIVRGCRFRSEEVLI